MPIEHTQHMYGVHMCPIHDLKKSFHMRPKGRLKGIAETMKSQNENVICTCLDFVQGDLR